MTDVSFSATLGADAVSPVHEGNRSGAASTSGSRVSRRRDRRRAEIVRTATRILSIAGYHGMNVEDVAEQTDVAKATLYHYFPSKDALVAAALEVLRHEVLSRLEARRQTVEDESVATVLRALIDEQILILTETAPEVAAVFSWPRQWPEAFTDAMREHRRRHDAVFREVVVQGVDDGEFNCGNINVVMQCLHGILNQSSVWIRPSVPADERAAVRSAVVDSAMRMFL